MAVSQNGYTANDVNLTVHDYIPGTERKVRLRKGPAGELLRWFAGQFDKRVESVDNDGELDDWGYAERPIRGSSVLSNHASGTALDLNAPEHPMGKSGTFTGRQVSTIRDLLGQARGCIRWGGDYTGRVDEMHFEIVKDEAACAAALKAVTGKDAPPSPAPGGGSGGGSRPTVKKGSRGAAVSLVQRYLGIPDDGIFGPKTDRAVRAYQSSQGLAVDGVVGPRTWARIDSGLGRSSSGSGGGGSSSCPTLKRGSKGAAVSGLQRYLNKMFPAYSKLVVDGAFGPATERAVREFQRRSAITADGVVGPTTWSRLYHLGE